MAISTLSLPTDIPWKRLAVSEDMYAPLETAPLPLKWHTSLAVFVFEPVPDPALSNPDEITSFLKVVATVSGFQPQGEEIDTAALTGSGLHDIVIQNFEKLTSQYYPCLASLVQVAVFPAVEGFPIAQFPYLTDFEPKKREIVELVSDTGEVLTQSATNLNVRKGSTTTDSIEISNIDRGGSFGASLSIPGVGGGGVQVSHQQEVGTRSALGTQAVNLTTTDTSREKRESFSHTTNLSQLYQLLDSYHSGTNRAIFFLNARPHIVDSPFTFVNGPRRLEGIQEFFLVVRRPKAMTDFCVKAVVETAHLHESDTTITEGTTVFAREQLTQTFSAHAGGGIFSGDTTTSAFNIQIPAGFKLDRSRGGGQFSVPWDDGDVTTGIAPAGVAFTLSGSTAGAHSSAIPNFTTFDDHVTFTTSITGASGIHKSDVDMSWTVTVFIVSIDPIATPTTRTEHHVDLFITAREVRGCTTFAADQAAGSPPDDGAGAPTGIVKAAPYVAYERALGPQVQAQLALARTAGKEAAVAANSVARAVRDEMVISFRPGKRYVPAAIDFVHTAFAVRDLLDGVTEPPPEIESAGARAQGAAVELPAAVSPALRAKVRATAPALSAADILKTPPETVAAHTGLSLREARELKLNSAGVSFRRAGSGGPEVRPPGRRASSGKGGTQAPSTGGEPRKG